MTLRTRLMLGLAAFVGALIVLGAWSAWHLWQMSALSERIIAENYNSVVAAEEMKESLDDQERAIPELKEHRARFEAAYRRAAANITEPGEAEVVRDDRQTERRVLPCIRSISR